MLHSILFFLHSIILLLFGVLLSAAFSGILFSKKNISILLGLCIFSGILQLLLFISYGEEMVRKWYPFIAHLPVIILLYTLYKKRLITAFISLSTAYLCCQPAKWFGVLTLVFTHSTIASYIIRIILLIVVAIVLLIFFTPQMSAIFNKDTRNVYIFGILPFVYYVYDYVTIIYKDFIKTYHQITSEFLPFFLSLSFVLFCFVYYKEYEQKMEAENKEQLLSIVAEQQTKEVQSVRRNEHRIKLLRHDMRLLLNNISLCLDNNDIETAKKLVSSHHKILEETTIQRYCSNTIINYILSDFSSRCHETKTEFICKIELGLLTCDEITFSTIISNALDNALNAQKELPVENRKIKLYLKTLNSKTLLSIKNTANNKIIIIDGMPITHKRGHGYGTQSIVYLTERLGGICQFSSNENEFLLRIVIP